MKRTAKIHTLSPSEQLEALENHLLRRQLAAKTEKEEGGPRRRSQRQCQPMASPQDHDLLILPWRKNKQGYAVFVIGNLGSVLFHHWVCLRVFGRKPNWPLECCDHINGTPLDNRRENLRITTPRENTRNGRGFKNAKGVSYHKKQNRWFARGTTLNKKGHHLGSFKTEQEALARRKLFLVTGL